MGFFLAYRLFRFLLKEKGATSADAQFIAEKVSLYTIIGTVIGARLFDLLFYQGFGQNVHDPWEALRFWEGGLASHGGVIGILLALIFFYRRFRSRLTFSFYGLLDLLCIPAMCAAGFIRIGNFFNQEILGRPTTMPWGVIFGHPADYSTPMPLHPVQLYEAIFYWGLGLLLYLKRETFRAEGRLVGLFFLICFSFRFAVEFFKAPQSALLGPGFPLEMGQLLSLPLFFLGLFFLKQSKRTRAVKRNER